MNNSKGEIFRRIRDFLAGRVLGITRDSALLHEVVKCLFCKVAINQDKDHLFFATNDPVAITKAYRATFSRLKKTLADIFDEDEELLLDPSSLAYVDSELNLLDFTDYDCDPLGDLYQTFISSAMRMTEGQFFTPHEAVSWLVEAVSPKRGDKIIDPACGTGGFLSYCARYLVRQNIDKQTINECLYGIEKDSYLTQLAKTNIALVTLLKPNIICGDSIERKTIGEEEKELDILGNFDIVLTNPPFGTRIKTGSEAARREYNLAYKWKLNKKTNAWINTNDLSSNTPPQILFLELCIKLLRQGGTMGVVVPESMISSPTASYVVNYLRQSAEINAVIGMPESLFKTSGKGGTHTKTCLIVATKNSNSVRERIDHKVFMAEAKWCGHDSRGNHIPYNDLPLILKNYRNRQSFIAKDHLGYVIKDTQIVDNILAPRYYNPDSTDSLNELRLTHDLVTIRQLVEDRVLSFRTGDEMGKLSYGSGNIPFVRTSDISNWEIKLDPKQGVSEELYLRYKDKQDVREGDILFVRDGTYLIGACAYISKYDTKMVYQSHIYKIRVEKPEIISPYLLLALISSEPVLKQVKAKRFTQDIIDSLGNRIYELVLPIPKNKHHQNEIINMVKKSIHDRIEARELSRKATQSIIDVDN